MRKISIMLLCSILFGYFIVPVSADTIDPYGVVCQETRTFEVSTKYTEKVIQNQLVHTNSTSTTQETSYTRSRSVYASAKLGSSMTSETNFGLIKFAVGISSEVSVGTSTSVSATIKVNVPAYTTVTLSIGYYRVYGSGRMKTVNTDCSITYSSTYTYDYSYKSFTGWE